MMDAYEARGSFEQGDVGRIITIATPRPRWWQLRRRWKARRPTVLGRIAGFEGTSLRLYDRNPMPRVKIIWRRRAGR